MKSKFLILLLFLAAVNGLFASGKKQKEEEKKPLAPTWTLCITAFDVSAMSPAWQTAGDTVARTIAAALQNLDFRSRGEDESAYHRDNALAKSRTAAMDALVKKRNERDVLLFKGDHLWKYEKELKKADGEILKLEQNVAAVKASTPVIEEKPLFKLNKKNMSNVFPPPPASGNERGFCAAEEADAFLTGRLSEYYGRIYLEIKMYTRHTNSYSYENSVLFSSEDLNKAVGEISDFLALEVSDTFPSAIIVHSNPVEAMVTIDGAFAGQGETELRTHSPGTAEISVTADNYVPVSFPIELNSGELAEVSVDLTPRGFTILEAEVSDKPPSKVFLGSLYVGETPVTLKLPSGESTYISVETPEGEIGSMVLKNGNSVSGSVKLVSYNDYATADFFTSVPVSDEEKKVEKARNRFYKSYGAFWFILPAALIAGGIAETHETIHHDVGTWSSVRMGSNLAWGTALGVTLLNIFRYLYVSRVASTPIVKVPPKED